MENTMQFYILSKDGAYIKTVSFLALNATY